MLPLDPHPNSFKHLHFSQVRWGIISYIHNFLIILPKASLGSESLTDVVWWRDER